MRRSRRRIRPGLPRVRGSTISSRRSSVPSTAWFDHLPRIAGMGFNWVLVSDPRDPELGDDEAALQAFTEAARGQNLRVMTDLAVGAPLGPAPALRIAEPEAHLERCLALGFEGFVCRSAAFVPPAEWAKLIAAARRAKGRELLRRRYPRCGRRRGGGASGRGLRLYLQQRRLVGFPLRLAAGRTAPAQPRGAHPVFRGIPRDRSACRP